MIRSIVVLCIIVSSMAVAQAPDTIWTKTYGGTEADTANSILLTNDGGYIFVGTTRSFGAGRGDVWILRTDSLGDTLWTKTYGDTCNDYANSIQHTTDGNYIIAGGIRDSVWLLKIDGNGDTLWTKKINPYQHTSCSARDVKQTRDGGYIITGHVFWARWTYMLLIRTDSRGDTLWVRAWWYGLGGDAGHSVQQTSDGCYVVTGFLGYQMSLYPLWKIDSLGNELWVKWYFGLPQGALGNCVLETADSGFISCGYIQTEFGILRADMSGDTLWTRGYDFAGYVHGTGFSLIKTSDSGYLTVGCLYDSNWNKDAVFLKTDSLGNIEWSTILRCELADCCLRSVQQTPDNGYIAVGYTDAFGAGGSDVWLVRLGPDVGVKENENISIKQANYTITIFRGLLQLPEGKKCRVFDITGRIVEPEKIAPGIYFVEIDNEVVQKVVKIR